MLENKKLFLILSLIGILILIILSQNLRPLKELSKSNENLQVSVSGKISSIEYYPKSTKIYLETPKVNLIILENVLLSLKQNDSIEATGKLQFENNQTSLIIDKIIKIKEIEK